MDLVVDERDGHLGPNDSSMTGCTTARAADERSGGQRKPDGRRPHSHRRRRGAPG
jgi:hypothetical protein